MSLQAYQQSTARAETTRQTEYRLFGQVTRALMVAAKADPSDVRTRADALDWNRRLWSALATDCGAPENTLPEPVRAHIISLAIWVGKYTSTVIRGEDDDIDTLVEVNRAVMQGLMGDTAEAA